MEKAIESDITGANVANHHHDEHETAIHELPIGDAHDHADESSSENGDHGHHE